MYPLYRLFWFHEDVWHEIGWHGDTPERKAELVKHGEALAKSQPGQYKLMAGWGDFELLDFVQDF